MKTTENNCYGLPENAVEKILSVLVDYPAIQKIIIFGSRAKGNYRKNSDIDICLQAPTLDFSQQLEIETRLDDLLLPWKVDLILKNHIENQALLEHIERVGRDFPCFQNPPPSNP